jgi:signal transduction histidine kinase
MDELTQENKIIQHDLNELSKYSSMLSRTVHDINNPLAVFVGQISILEMLIEKDKLTPEKLDKVISKFKSSTDKFRSRLEDLRSFYKVPLNDQDFNKLGNILDSTLYFYENQLYNNDISYEIKIDKSADFKIPGPHLFLCFKHIIQNSIEALTNVDEGKITVTSSKTDDVLTIKIKDNGPGLKVSFDDSCILGYSTKPQSGLGSGLSIVKALSIKDNFEILYNYDKGAEFIINISTK